ncbi:MAG: YceD family protein [Casimicrobiaceae bacterium]
MDDAPPDAERPGQLPKWADWQRVRSMRAFARLTASLEACLDSACFERMEGAAIVGGVAARIMAVSDGCSSAGGSSARASTHRPGFTVEAKARLRLTCQSCGEPFAHAMSAVSTLWVAEDERELLAWEEAAARADIDSREEDDGRPLHGAAELEIVLADEQASAVSLVEDELLLALPVVPRCPTCANRSEPQRFSFGD